MHRQLYKQFKLPKSFTSEDVKNILKQVSGNDYRQWWQQHVDSPVSLDFDVLLSKVGLELYRPEGAKPIASLAVVAESKGQLLQLKHVARDSSAWQAGLTSGDKIVAFNGHHVRDNLLDSLTYFEGGETVKVDFIRRDKLKSTEVKLDQDFDKQKRVRAIASPSDVQQRLFKAWTGVDHPEAEQGVK